MPHLPSPTENQNTKQTLRRRILAARESITAAKRAASSARIAERLLAMPSFQKAKTVLLYYSFGSEWHTPPLIREALRQGKTVALPRVMRPIGISKIMSLHTIEEPTRDTEPGMMGIFEPHAERPIVAPGQIDWALIPGVAFTPTGDRLGYGAGLFDWLLPQIPRRVPRVAGAFDVQMIETMPIEPHDCPADVVFTETRVFRRPVSG